MCSHYHSFGFIQYPHSGSNRATGALILIGALIPALCAGRALSQDADARFCDCGGDTKSEPSQADAAQRRVLRVAADPNNMPFSNNHCEGFENKIAELLAREMGAELQY